MRSRLAGSPVHRKRGSAAPALRTHSCRAGPQPGGSTGSGPQPAPAPGRFRRHDRHRREEPPAEDLGIRLRTARQCLTRLRNRPSREPPHLHPPPWRHRRRGAVSVAPRTSARRRCRPARRADTLGRETGFAWRAARHRL